MCQVCYEIKLNKLNKLINNNKKYIITNSNLILISSRNYNFFWLSFSIRWLLEIFVKQKRNAVQQVLLPPVLSKTTNSCTLAYPWICCNLSFMQHSTCNFVCGSRAVFSYSSHVLAVYFLATAPTSLPYLPSFVAATCARTHTRAKKQADQTVTAAQCHIDISCRRKSPTQRTAVRTINVTGVYIVSK